LPVFIPNAKWLQESGNLGRIVDGLVLILDKHAGHDSNFGRLE